MLTRHDEGRRKGPPELREKRFQEGRSLREISWPVRLVSLGLDAVSLNVAVWSSVGIYQM